jgi:AcrR family transcriptional regulator
MCARENGGHGNSGKDTRGAILEAAWALFSERGYEATTVDDILSKCGASKGSFYHHFPSKEAVLDAVVERSTQSAVDGVAAVLQGSEGSAIEKFNALEAALQLVWVGNFGVTREILRVLSRDENVIIIHKMFRRNVALTAPVLAQVIEQGVREGAFNVTDPRGTAEIISHFANKYYQMQAASILALERDPGQSAILERRVNFGITLIERMLGAAEGSLDRLGGAFAGALQESIRPGTEA